ncbi:MAG TPA: DUF1573 domain-containing protein [Cytophagales bacterium]|nr:DUF1573 domain-containing protein [Cytophagales bacterium]
MKRNIIAILCLAVANLLAQPAFRFASESYDFGEVPEGPQAIYSFEFTNVGDKPLVISHAQASCGCTVPEWSKDTIKPGGKGFVKAIYNTAGRLGPFSKSITINYNNESEPSKTLFIRGTVIKAEEKPTYTKEQLAASPILTIDKTSYSFGKVERGQKVSQKFTVKNTGKGVLKISEFHSVCNCIVSELSKPEIKPGQSASLKITYNPTGTNDVTDILTIKSNDITKDPVKLTLKAVVVESLNKKTILNEGGNGVPFGK